MKVPTVFDSASPPPLVVVVGVFTWRAQFYGLLVVTIWFVFKVV